MLSCEILFYLHDDVSYHRVLISFQGELILDMTYGYEVKGHHDRKLVASKQMNEFASVKVPASAWIIGAFPFRM